MVVDRQTDKVSYSGAPILKRGVGGLKKKYDLPRRHFGFAKPSTYYDGVRRVPELRREPAFPVEDLTHDLCIPLNSRLRPYCEKSVRVTNNLSK